MNKYSFKDVNKKLDTFKRTALHFAAQRNDLAQAELLLAQGADVNAKDLSHKTPLHYAVNQNKGESHYKLVELLLKSGANVNAQDGANQTPIQYLVTEGNLKIVQLFLDYKADIHSVSDDGGNSLASAVYNRRNVEVIQLLIDLGLEVNYQDYNGKTALHWACELHIDNINIIKCLLKNGVNMNTVNDKGYPPLIEAVRNRFSESNLILKKKFKFLIEHTAFDVIHDNVNYLSLEYESGEDYLWEEVLKHFAKLRFLNIPVHPVFLDFITSEDEFNDYYTQCQDELSRAKNSKLPNSWVSFYNLLVDGRKKLKNYAGNEDLIEDFQKSDCVQKFPFYGLEIKENVKKGVNRRKLFDDATILLSNCLPIFNPTHLVIRDVLDCVLSKKDLSKFCNEN